MSDKLSSKNKKNRPDTKTLVISIVLLAAAAAMLIWLGFQLWTSHTLKRDYDNSTLTPTATLPVSASEKPEGDLNKSEQASEAPKNQDTDTNETSAVTDAPNEPDAVQDSDVNDAGTATETTPEPEYGKTFGLDTE